MERAAAEETLLGESLEESQAKVAKLEVVFSKLFNENQNLIEALRTCKEEAVDLKAGFDRHVREEREKAAKLETEASNLKEMLEFMRRSSGAELKESRKRLEEVKAEHSRQMQAKAGQIRDFENRLRQQSDAMEKQAEERKSQQKARDREWADRVEQRGKVLDEVVRGLRRDNEDQSERLRRAGLELSKERERAMGLEAELRKHEEVSKREDMQRLNGRREDTVQLEARISRQSESIRKLERKLLQAKVGRGGPGAEG